MSRYFGPFSVASSGELVASDAMRAMRTHRDRRLVTVENLPVTDREGVPALVSVERGRLAMDVDGLSHSPLEPVRFLVEYGDLRVGDGVLSIAPGMVLGSAMFSKRRGTTMFFDPRPQTSFGFSYITCWAVTTLDLIHRTSLFR